MFRLNLFPDKVEETSHFTTAAKYYIPQPSTEAAQVQLLGQLEYRSSLHFPAPLSAGAQFFPALSKARALGFS